jgi:hypothetical protein
MKTLAVFFQQLGFCFRLPKENQAQLSRSKTTAILLIFHIMKEETNPVRAILKKGHMLDFSMACNKMSL